MKARLSVALLVLAGLTQLPTETRAYGGGITLLHLLPVLGSCSERATETGLLDTGPMEELLCTQPDARSYVRQVDDETIRAIAAACDPGKRVDCSHHAVTDALTPECDAAIDSLISPLLDSESFTSDAGKTALQQLKEALAFLLFARLRTPADDEMWGSANAACFAYADAVLDSSRSVSGLPPNRPTEWLTTLQSNPILSASTASVNATLFRYLLERLDTFSFDAMLKDAAAQESNGEITLGSVYGTGLTEVSASGSLVHEARHIDSPNDGGANHVECRTGESMQGLRFCDDDLFGANGLEIQYYDALLRGMGNRTVRGLSGQGCTVPALSGDQIKFAIYETCMTVNYKINEPDPGVAALFAPYKPLKDGDPNCLTGIWQNTENAARIACAVYGIRLPKSDGTSYPCP